MFLFNLSIKLSTFCLSRDRILLLNRRNSLKFLNTGNLVAVIIKPTRLGISNFFFSIFKEKQDLYYYQMSR